MLSALKIYFIDHRVFVEKNQNLKFCQKFKSGR